MRGGLPGADAAPTATSSTRSCPGSAAISALPPDAAAQPTPTEPLRRVARNVGWLAAARSFTGVLSIFYLAIAARALGPRDFGVFTLVLTYGQLLANLVQFQSWKGVIRFGAVHHARRRSDRLARLFGFTATLDLAGFLLGAFAAVVAAPLIGPWLHWTPHEEIMAAVFGVVLLMGTSGTPTGILRLFDRFDLLATSEGIAPTVRLVGAAAVWALGGGVVAFLAVWAMAAVGQTFVQWLAAIFVQRVRFQFGRKPFLRAIRENRRSLRFMLLTNVSNSLSMFWMQLGTLSVGAVTGSASAGGFRIADRLSKGVAKPVEIVTRALFPELARMSAEKDYASLTRLLARTTIAGFALAMLMIAVMAFAGSTLIALIVGKDFAFAHTFLLLLAIASAFDLTGFALEPFHTAQGRAGRVLRIRLIGAAAYVLVLAIALPRIGANGAAVASIAASAVMFAQLAVSTLQILRGRSEARLR